ncbi:MAG: two-component system chemotaxis response regulator CheY [bacterium]|jgi:two-component system chemotaxis response regulator CheY
MRILIVEDDSIQSHLLNTILKSYGACTIANDGLEGVNTFCEFTKKGEEFDIIFMDIMMPRMNGRDALIEIRKWEKAQNQKKTQVVMVSAIREQHTIYSLFNEGAECYIIKPYRVRSIKNLMNDLGHEVRNT